MHNNDRWLKPEEAANRAAVSRWTIYQAIASGGLRHVRVGGRRSIRIRPEWVDDWLVGHAAGGSEREQQRETNDLG